MNNLFLMETGFFFLAVCLLIVAHICRLLRWQILLQPFVCARVTALGLSLSGGLIGNALFPLKLGELVRAWVLARVTGLPFSMTLASIGVERWLDALLLWLGLTVLGSIQFVQLVPENWAVAALITVPVMLWSVLILCVSTVFLFQKPLRFARPLIRFSSWFHPRIQFHILATVWHCHTLLHRFRHPRPLLLTFGYTVLMWLSYALSFIAFALFFNQAGILLTAVDLVRKLVVENWALSDLSRMALSPAGGFVIAWMVLPVLVIGVVLELVRRSRPERFESRTLPEFGLYPVTDKAESPIIFPDLNFALQYVKAALLAENSREILEWQSHCRKHLILNFTPEGPLKYTVELMNAGQILLQKWGIGAMAAHRKAEFQWLLAASAHLPIPPVAAIIEQPRLDLFGYNLALTSGQHPFFMACHHMTEEASCQLLRSVLETLEINLYTPTRKGQRNAHTQRYVTEHFLAALNAVREFRFQHDLVWNYPTLWINDVEYDNLQDRMDFLTVANLVHALDHDVECNIHGQLTMAAIVVDQGQWWLVDPQPDPAFTSFTLDLGTLWLSLNAGLEIRLLQQDIQVSGNRIYYKNRQTRQYQVLADFLIQEISRIYGTEILKRVHIHGVMQLAIRLGHCYEQSPRTAMLLYATLVEQVDALLCLYPGEFEPERLLV